MSAQNNGVNRLKAVPLDSYQNAYIQGVPLEYQAPAPPIVNTIGTVAIGKTQPDSVLGLEDPTSSFVEASGRGFIFHTGLGTAFQEDAKISVLLGSDIEGGGVIQIITANMTWLFNEDGSITINGDVGTAGEKITSGGPGVPVTWA